MIFHAALLVALISTHSAPRPEQELGPALARIRSGALLRVEVAGGDRLEGRLRRVTADSVLLAGQGGERWIALERIEQLHERGRATRTAAIIGGVAGGLAVGAAVTFVCAIGRSDDGVIGNENRWGDCALVGGAIGGAGGAAIGAGIGSFIPKWHMRYRSRR